MATLSGTSLGIVQREKQAKDSGLTNFPLPRSDSSSSILLDLFGVTRTITLEGRYEGTTEEIRTFIATIEGYASGTQSGLTFQSDLISSTKTVFIQNFEWAYNEADTSTIQYTLIMLEGAAVS